VSRLADIARRILKEGYYEKNTRQNKERVEPKRTSWTTLAGALPHFPMRLSRLAKPSK
jgi:hypothetical protein